MAISEVDFAAFSSKHLYLVEGGVSSSDVMAEAVARLTGRAALKLGVKKVLKSGVIKYSGEFDAQVVSENQAKFRSGTTINGLIAVTAHSMAAWYEVIVAAANATAENEFHVEYVLEQSAGMTLELSDKKSYGSDLAMTGGYKVRADVLFVKEMITAKAVHLNAMSYDGPVIEPDSLKNQSAILSLAFLSGLSAL